MLRLVKIGKAVYEADDDARTYKFFCRNRDWGLMTRAESEKNKKSLEGYARVFRNGKKQVFHYKESGK